MSYGITHDDEVANQYADRFGRAVYPVVFAINHSLPHLGCSPGRKVCDPSENNPWGLLEIKYSPSDYFSDLNYLKHKGRTGSYSLKESREYYYQTMECIGLTGSAWEDFFFLFFAGVNSTVEEFILILPFSQRCLKSSTTSTLTFIFMLLFNKCKISWGIG